MQDIPHFLNVSDEDIFPPSSIAHIEEAAKLLTKHIAMNSDIYIVVDCDVDGYTSSAILINYLHEIFPSFVENHITYRLQSGKGHGLVEDIMEEIPNNIKLVILPDAGTNDFKQHKELKERGIDILIIDHHESDEPPVDACFINNQLCNYPTKSLSGAGMVFKFCSYLDNLFETKTSTNYLDLCALGCVADMVSLKDFETKRLVELGLTSIKNLFLAKIIDKQSFKIKGKPNPFNISFYVAPLMNAVIRIGTQEEKLTLFESMLDYKGEELIPSTKRGCKGQLESRVEQACRICTNAKNHQTTAVDKSLEKIEEKIESENLLNNQILLVTLSEEENKNITGLIANQLMGKYKRPVLLLRETREGNYEGSARGYDKSSFDDFRSFMRDCGYANYAAGHKNAFGTSIPARDINNFIDYSNNVLAEVDFSPSYKVDFIYDAKDDFREELMDMINLEEKWWSHAVDEEARIAVEKIKVTKDNIKLMAKGTLKITLPNSVDLIKFGVTEEEYEELYSSFGCVTLNVVGTAKRNEWNGIVSPQILINSFEIVDRADYYF